MKKDLSLIALIGLTLFLTGCNDYTSPQGVTGIAGQAIRKNDLGKLHTVLLGKASRDYGTPQAFEQLREQLQYVENLHIEDLKSVKRLDYDTFGNEMFGADHSTLYRFEIVGDVRYLKALVKNRHLFTASADCEFRYRTHCERASCTTTESRRCWIVDLN